MKKCVIWGTGNDYDRLYNAIRLEECKGNISILAAVTKRENIFAKFLDNVPLIDSSELCKLQYDYIIVCSGLYYDEICREIQELGIDRNKVINAAVFGYARFDFARYSQLIENPVTIISDDCWGGYIYNMFSLQFSSPTINIEWEKEEYAKFILDLPYYLSQSLKCEREGDFEKGECPIGLLGESDRQVRMKLVHNNNFEEAKQQWERRNTRVNFNNIFIKFGFDRSDNWELCMDAFDKLNYNKICFFNDVKDKKGYINSAVYKRWLGLTHMNGIVNSYSIAYTLGNPHNTHKVIDILAMLNGESNYFRDSDVYYDIKG